MSKAEFGRADPATVRRLARSLAAEATSWPDAERRALELLLQRSGGESPWERLARRDCREVLTPEECGHYRDLIESPDVVSRSRRPSLVLIMKATRLCNLRCSYCHFWRSGPNQIMSFEVLARTIRDALGAPGVKQVDFVWHGGEITLLPPAFLRKALWLQAQFRRPGQRVVNAIQTNGTRLTPEWLDLLKKYRVEVGVSLDGPPELHDRVRVDARGGPTSARVVKGVRQLREHGIRHGVLMVVGPDVIELGAERVLEYLLESGVPAVGLLNVIPENNPRLDPADSAYLPWPRYVEWLRELFAAWWPTHTDRLMIRELDDLIGKVGGAPSKVCLFAGDCHGRYLTVEPTGEVSACDKYVDDAEYVFGSTISEALASPAVDRVRRQEAERVARMADCRWIGVCAGGCAHDRRLSDRHLGTDPACCGLAPLLGDISAARTAQRR